MVPAARNLPATGTRGPGSRRSGDQNARGSGFTLPGAARWTRDRSPFVSAGDARGRRPGWLPRLSRPVRPARSAAEIRRDRALFGSQPQSSIRTPTAVSMRARASRDMSGSQAKVTITSLACAR